MDSLDNSLVKLREKQITHLQFLTEVNCDEQFKKWCEEHCVEADEKNAQLYFDYYGFEDSAIVKEFIEPLTQ